MASAFRRSRSRVKARLDHDERLIVATLIDQTLEVVAPVEAPSSGDAFTDLMATIDDSVDPTEVQQRDPVLRRLLPDGNREDPKAAQEFRDATERSLREQKAANLLTARDALMAIEETTDRVDLDVPTATALMRALADVRLALGERLELRTDEDSERLHEELEQIDAPPQEPRMIAAIYYDFLTWLQESLAVALMPR